MANLTSRAETDVSLDVGVVYAMMKVVVVVVAGSLFTWSNSLFSGTLPKRRLEMTFRFDLFFAKHYRTLALRLPSLGQQVEKAHLST